MDKAIKLATKPKRAAPKAKYIDPIVQGTFAQDGSLQEIIKSLAIRLRDENTTVIFKSLLVLHTLLRSGSLESTFSYLTSSSLSLSLSSSETPNLSAYAAYLSIRIRAYGTLQRDIIRDKSDRRPGGNRLRKLGVEEGLLREVRECQRCISGVVDCKFYLDDIDDDVSMTALRLLVKDLLILFQAVNEGVINVLEHYFEMSHADASTALKIYKTFCRDTEKVVAYFAVAKKLMNVLNVQIPNLKHAPVSLAGSLEEYLSDPNFAANREEYKENKRIADGGVPRAKAAPAKTTATAAPVTNGNEQSQATFTDFFESIEAAQTTMFNPSNDSPTSQYFQQQAAFNPFLQQQQPGGYLMPQATGMGYAAFGQHPFGPPQPLQNQFTGYPAPSPFSAPSPFPPQQQQFPPQQFLQQQATGFPSFPPQQMPMMTGGPNPFRQTMMMTGAPPPMPPMPSFPSQTQFPSQNQFAPPPLANSLFPPQAKPPQKQQSLGPPPSSQQLVPQATGSKNPFNRGAGEAPRMQKVEERALSMNSLSLGGSAFGTRSNGNGMNGFENNFNQNGGQNQGYGGPALGQFGQGSASQGSATPPIPKPLVQSQTGMGSIASEFAFAKPFNNLPSSTSMPFPYSAATNPSSQPSFLSQPPTNYTTTSPTPLVSQATGYTSQFERKPFVPTSSFGTNLENEIPRINPFRNEFTPPQQAQNGNGNMNNGFGLNGSGNLM